MNSFGFPKKKIPRIQFCSFKTQGKAPTIFLIFDDQSERGLVNSVPFVCPLVPSFVINNKEK